MIRNLKSNFIALVYFAGMLPAYMAWFISPNSTENFVNAENLGYQILLSKLMGVILITIALLIWIDSVMRRSIYLNPVLFIILPFLINALIQSFKRDSLVIQTILQSLIYILLFASTDADSWKIKRNIEKILTVTLCLEIFLAIYGRNQVWDECRVDKCLFPGQLVFVGQFTTGNATSVFFGFLCVVSLIAFSGKKRLFFVCVYGILAILAGGRSPIVALGICILASRIHSLHARRFLAGSVLIVSIIPVFYELEDSRITFRGYLWRKTRQHLLDSQGYSSQIQFPEFVQQYLSYVPRTTSSPHNLWLGIWWDGGIVGMIFFIPIIVGLIVGLTSRDTRIFLLFIYYLALNITEPISSFTHFDTFSWILTILLITWNRILVRSAKENRVSQDS